MSDLELVKSEISKLAVSSRGRRRYSEAIRNLALKLHSQGVSLKSIADAVGVHATTLHYWKERAENRSKFKELKVKVPNENQKNRSTIEITFDSGTTVSGLSFFEISELLKQELVR